jgi:hypothetical protein
VPNADDGTTNAGDVMIDMRSRRVGGLCMILVLVAAACARDGDRAADGTVVAVTDGVTSVVLPQLEATAGPAWRLAESYSTMDTPPGVELHQVGDAVFLDDGALAIANSGNREILVLDVDGTERSRFGRQGDGPGEFNAISWLEAGADGGVIAYDPRQARLTFLSAEGEVLDTRRLAPPSRVVDLRPLALLEDGGAIAIYGEMRIFAPTGERRDTTPLFRFDADLTMADTVAMLPAKEWAYISILDGSARTPVGFGRDLAIAGRNGRSAFGPTDSLDIAVFDASGEVTMRVSGGGLAVPVSPADLDEFRQNTRDRLTDAPEAMRRAFEEAPARETWPAFERLLIDDTGRLWIGAVTRPGQTLRRWVVLGTDGNVAGALDTPADATLLDAAANRLAMLLRSELDEEYIGVYRIEPE